MITTDGWDTNVLVYVEYVLIVQVYKTTTLCRGRALLINNKYFEEAKTRDGSEIDFCNMMLLLHKLNIYITPLTNLTTSVNINACFIYIFGRFAT